MTRHRTVEPHIEPRTAGGAKFRSLACRDPRPLRARARRVGAVGASGSRPRVTVSTSSAAPSATCSSVPGRGDFDIDLTTDARPPEIKRCLDGWADSIWTQGEKFGTIGAQRDTGAGPRIYEITTFRAESYTDDSRKPHVVFADAIESDLSRRDFTVNAMALELTGGQMPELVDPFGGAADLATRVLRTPLGPEVSFTDDPLRMLRAARFIAGYELEPDADAGRRRHTDGEPPRDRLVGTHPRRARQADHRRPSGGRTVVPRRHRLGGAVPPGTAGAATRARPDPPAQGRAQPHHRRGRQRPTA